MEILIQMLKIIGIIGAIGLIAGIILVLYTLGAMLRAYDKEYRKMYGKSK